MTEVKVGEPECSEKWGTVGWMLEGPDGQKGEVQAQPVGALEVADLGLDPEGPQAVWL